MLFGGNAGHRLEPVSIVGGALFDGPVFHRLGHNIRRLKIKAVPFGNRLSDLIIDIGRELRFHRLVAEDIAGEVFGEIYHIFILLTKSGVTVSITDSAAVTAAHFVSGSSAPFTGMRFISSS